MRYPPVSSGPTLLSNSYRLLPAAFRHLRINQWLQPLVCAHMFTQHNYQLMTSLTTRGTTPATEAIFSLATAMTHFLPPQSYFLGLFPDGRIGSLLIPAWVIRALICWEDSLHLNNWLSSRTVLMLLKTLLEWLACLSGCASAAR